jgi:ligand-binding sensor domain-containing protein
VKKNIPMKMRTNIFCRRRLAAAIALLMLSCGAPSHAWCANLWAAFDSGGGIESYTSGQLAKSGTPTPIQLSTFSEATGLAFDKSHNLWAVICCSEVVEFTARQLKNLKHDPSPTPEVSITSPTYNLVIGCSFDHQGNLWLASFDGSTIEELSKAQLVAGSANVTPAIVITSSDLDHPNFVTFDKVGNAWVASEYNDKIAEFSASQLTVGGPQSPAVLLSDDGSGSLNEPGEIAFDREGNLWVPNQAADTVVEYAKAQLASSGSPTPTVTLSSAVFDGPWGAVFDSGDNLVVMNYDSGTIAKFTPKQLKASGAPIPKVSVTGTEKYSYQIIFGPAS